MRITDNKLTKIVATLGPASETEDIVADLIREGVNVFRFNTKHGTPEWHEERIQRVQKVADRLKVPVGILLDLQGPELRLETKDQEPVEVANGDILKIGLTMQVKGVKVSLPHAIVFDVLKPGDQVLIDDGYIEATVESTGKDYIDLKMHTSSFIKHRKGVNLPGKHIDLPSLIEADLKQLDMASINKVDFVALSFVRTKKDIEILRTEMQKRGMNAKIVAKIESQPALDHLDEIIDISDSVMVARGDLGVEVPIEQLAYWQKEIIMRCRKSDKPVITATQMLESMINNPRPTRAEATDVANAVLDGTDAIMLSAETAAGKYPVRAVQHMTKISAYNEQHSELCTDLDIVGKIKDMTEQVAHAAVSMIKNPYDKDPINRVVIFTETGYTARSFASYRLPIPIVAVTDSKKTVETLTLSYGVSPIYTQFPEGEFIDPGRMIERLREKDIIYPDEKVLVIHGRHWKVPGLTNSLTVIKV